MKVKFKEGDKVVFIENPFLKENVVKLNETVVEVGTICEDGRYFKFSLKDGDSFQFTASFGWVKSVD